MRCPVPYAIVALFGWGLLDVAVERAHRLLRRVRPARTSPMTERDTPPTRA